MNPERWQRAEGLARAALEHSEDADTHPSASPGGRYVVFESSLGGAVGSIWRVDIEGGDPARLTEG